jgi:UDPglucose 6-dehydrogenase
MTTRIAFVGMTHLGLVSGSGAAAKGFETVCYDPDAALIARLQKGELPVLEPDLDDLVVKNGVRQIFTADPAALGTCDVVYIAPDVPTDDTGGSDLTGIRTLIDNVIPWLGPQAILVVLCQVPPGFTRSLPLPSDRLYYQVETLIFGRAVERTLLPERFIVGCADPEAELTAHFSRLLQAYGCPILPMRYESAELAKISINMCLVASISVANTLAELCEKIGAAWHEIVPALKLDRRIGPYSYLAPGLGIAGGNLERDLATVIDFAQQHDTDAGVVKAWIANSVHRRNWAAKTIRALLPALSADPQLAVWGLAYKENTHSVKNSPSLATLAQLRDLHVRLHDPVVPAEKAQHPNAIAAADALAAVDGADALAILTPWPEYKQVEPSEIAARMRGRILLDPYRIMDSKAVRAAGLDYYTLGMPPVSVK